MKCQGCWLPADGAAIAARSRPVTASSDTGSSVYVRMLRLERIASIHPPGWALVTITDVIPHTAGPKSQGSGVGDGSAAADLSAAKRPAAAVLGPRGGGRRPKIKAWSSTPPRPHHGLGGP